MHMAMMALTSTSGIRSGGRADTDPRLLGGSAEIGEAERDRDQVRGSAPAGLTGAGAPRREPLDGQDDNNVSRANARLSGSPKSGEAAPPAQPAAPAISESPMIKITVP